MALRPLPIDPWEGDIPNRARQLIDSAKECLEAFHIRHHRQPVPGFYPSDFELVYRTFAAVDAHCRKGRSSDSELTIREWGAGIPVVSALATLFDWKSLAVECDDRLIEAGRMWMQSEALDIDLRHASFIPKSWVDEAHRHEAFKGIVVEPANVPALSVKELRGDIVYAYPWPGEAEVIESLFRLIAQPDDLLVSFHGSLELRVQRMVPST